MELWAVQMDGVLLRLDHAMNKLTDRMSDLHIAEARLDAKMAELAESQAHAEQRLKALKDIIKAKRKRKGSV